MTTWNDIWLSTVQSWPYSERALWVTGTFIFHHLAWYSFNILLYFVYHFNLFPKYKIQGAKWPDRDLVIKCLIGNTVNHFIIYPIGLYFLYPIFTYFGTEIYTPIPHWTTFVWQIILFFIINDFLFYWSHRTLHHPLIYKHIHKKHHLFKQTIGIAAEFAHPVEDILANSVPTLAGPVLLGAHASVFWVYLFLRIWETIDAHSGFKFPWSPWDMFPFLMGGSQFHDFHHSVNIGNYGMLRFWDWAMGTDKKYRDYYSKKID